MSKTLSITTTEADEDWIKKVDGGKWQKQDIAASKPKGKDLGDEAGAFASELDALVLAAYRKRMSVAAFAAQMDALLAQYIRASYLEGLAEGGVTEDEMDKADEQAIRDMIAAQREYVDGFAAAVMDAKQEADLRAQIDNRIVYWARSIRGAAATGLDSALKNEVVEWQLGNTEHHCTGVGSCSWLNGQRHRRSWFAERGFNEGIPGASMPCFGFNCDCKKVPVRNLKSAMDAIHQGN